MSDRDFISFHNVSFPSYHNSSLTNFDFAIRKGEIHALLGEHGCGKSILCKIVGGVIQQRSGTIRINGKDISHLTTKAAHRYGIRIITQENQMFEHMTAASNLFLNNRNVFRVPFKSHRKLCRNAEEYLEKWNIDIDPETELWKLNAGDRLLVHVLKNLYYEPKLLVLDECFEKLTASYREKLKNILREMNAKGMTILYVTHKIDELYEFAHRVTIVRDGKILYTDSVDKTDKINLIRLTYTQMPEEEKSEDPTQEFYTLLKYNQAILERLPVNLVVVDSEKRIKIINDAAKTFFRVNDTRYFNNPLSSLFQENEQAVDGRIQKAVDEKMSTAFYDQKINIHNNIRRVNLTIFPVFDGNYFLGSIVIFNDVTEQEKLREQIILSEKLSSIGLLSAGVAHEINNPLEIIYHYLDHIRSAKNPTEIDEVVSNIESEIESISNIIRNLINLGGNNMEKEEKIELNEMIDSIIKLVKYNAHHRNISVTFQRNAGECFVYAKSTEIKQVVLNIIKNAFEAMDKEGELIVETSEIMENGTRFLKTDFKDTGKGINVTNKNDLFLPFFTTKEGKAANLGLGLSISFSIVQNYGGRIDVTTRGTGGSVFSVILPLLENGAV